MTDQELATQKDATGTEAESDSEKDLRSHFLPPAKEPESSTAYDVLSQAKSQLVIGVPFLGMMVMTCHYRFTDYVPTAAAHSIRTNVVFWNEQFLCQILSAEERVFVLAHEILHIFLEHIGRQIEYSYNPSLWNVATDYAINGFLQEMIDADRRVSKYMIRPEFGLYDERFLGLSADEIYHKLLEENPGQSPNDIANQHGGGSGACAEVGNGTAKGQKVMDEVPQEQQTEHSKNQNKQTTAAALEMSPPEKSRGDSPLGLVRSLQELIEPQIPWGSLLADFVHKTVSTDYTYRRPSRRSQGDIVFPSLDDGDKIDVCFGVDTSGSMSQTELTEAISELAGIMEQFDQWSLALISCDTDSHHLGDYSSEDDDDIRTINKGLVGGGGTELSPMVRYANEMEDLPNVCVIVTDGYIAIDPVDEAAMNGEVPVFIILTSSGAEEYDLPMRHCRVLKMDPPGGKKKH